MSDNLDRPRPRHPERDEDYYSLGHETNLNPALAYIPHTSQLSGPGTMPVPLTPPLGPSQTDVQGSYTGVPMYDEKPVQDADDL